MRDLSGVDRRILLAVVLLALALRIAYVFDISDSPYFDHLTLDAFWYDAKAKDVLAGDVLASTGTFRVPLYIYFIAGTYWVFGPTPMAPVLIQAILGAVACGLLYLIGKRLFGTLTGVIAGFGFAIYRMAVFSTGELLPSTLLLLLVLAVLHFIVRGLAEKPTAHGLLAGLCLGLAFLARPDVVPFAVAMILVVVFAFRSRHGVRIAVTVSAVLACFMFLQGLRNYAIFDRFFIFSPQGAVNLYIGNAPYADGKTPVAPPTSHPYEIGTDPSQDSIILGCSQAALEDTGRELSNQELSSYYVRRTIREIGGDLPRWLGLMGRKAYYFLNSYERSDIKLIPGFIERYSAVLKLPFLPFAVPMSLGLTGLALALWRRNRLALLASAGVVAYAVNTIAFFVVWRYRLPVVPFLMILSGLTVSEFLGAARRHDLRLAFGIGVAVVMLLVLSVSSFWDVDKEDWSSQYMVNEAALYLEAGDYERAIDTYKEAVRIDPGNARARFYLGKAYATEGHVQESKEMMEEAVRLNPNYKAYAYLSLGVALANKGMYEAAVRYFAEALEADSELGLAAFNLGLSLLNLGRIEEAETAFTRAEKLCKEDTGTLAAISRAYIRMGKFREGISLAERILREDPGSAEALFAIGLGLEAEGRTVEALRYFESALRQQPGSPEIMRKIRSLRASRVSG